MKNLEKQATLVMVAMALALSVSAEASQRPFIFVPVRDDPFSFWSSSGTRVSDRSEVRPSGHVRVQVVPKRTEVYVDGEFAGLAGQFDGVFRRLRTTPAFHRISLHLDGFRTVTEDIDVAEDSTVTIQRTMDKLPEGESSAPVPDPEP